MDGFGHHSELVYRDTLIPGSPITGASPRAGGRCEEASSPCAGSSRTHGGGDGARSTHMERLRR